MQKDVCSVCGMKHSSFIHTDTMPQLNAMNPEHVDNDRAGRTDMAEGMAVGETFTVKTHVISILNWWW